MERSLEFEKFRNLGFNKKEKLILNHTLKKGSMGNLVIVVGANNSGKSNVLDALTEFSNRKLSDKDITTFSYEDANRHPSLTLCVKDGESVYYYKLTYNNENNLIGYPQPRIDYQTVKKQDMKILQVIIKAFKEYGIKDDVQVKQNFEDLNKTNVKSEIEEIDNNLLNIIERLKDKAYSHGSYYRYAWNYIIDNCQSDRHCLNNTNKLSETVLRETFLNNYGIDFFPQIYKYVERQISDENLITTVDRINNNGFFKAVFSVINIKVDEINNAYSMFYKLGNKGILKDLENKINEKLKNVAKKFNDLYSFEKETYKFEIDLESEKIFFIMKRGKQSIVLNYQSTGFKWFFNLYFNFLCSNTLKSGDIVIMDEPATNLHVRGQQELRVFLKEFAIKNDITIVLATHSPFLVDLDYLDELRVVSMENNVSHICNDFSTIDIDDPDSLKPIKEALTVTNNHLFDPDTKVVFVEGITDYNYMVAFKKKFNKDNILFLPIQGIGKYGSSNFKDKQKEISKKLIKIKKNSPILMVDGDNAGKSIKNVNNDSQLNVFMLTDVKSEFKTIENLFSEADQENLGIKMEDGKFVKLSSMSALFKTFVLNNKMISKDTENNFKLVFDYIENL